MTTQIQALLNLIDAVLFIVLSIPLVLRKVPMNRLYGARFAVCFKSNENWYAINQASGRFLLAWSLPVLALGIAGFFLPKTAVHPYSLWSAVVTIGCIIVACAQSYLFARRFEAGISKK